MSRTTTARTHRPRAPRAAASWAAAATRCRYGEARCSPGDNPPVRAAARGARAARPGLVTVSLQQRAITPPIAACSARHRRGHGSRNRGHPARGRSHSSQGSVRCLTMRRAVTAPDRTFGAVTPDGPCKAPDTPPAAPDTLPVTAVTPPAGTSSAASRAGGQGVWTSERIVRSVDTSGRTRRTAHSLAPESPHSLAPGSRLRRSRRGLGRGS